MGRIKNQKLYPIDKNISPKDIILGSDGDLIHKTKNYEVASLTQYLATNYNTNQPDFAFEYGSSASTGMFTSDNYVSTKGLTDVANITLNTTSFFQKEVGDYIEAWDSDNFLLSIIDQTEPNNFGIYSVDSIVDVTSTSKKINLTLVEGNGVFVDERIYGYKIIGRPNIQSDWNQTDNTSADFIKNKPDVDTQVQADWGEVDTQAKSYINNKPENISDFNQDIDYVKSEDYDTAYTEDFAYVEGSSESVVTTVTGIVLYKSTVSGLYYIYTESSRLPLFPEATNCHIILYSDTERFSARVPNTATRVTVDLSGTEYYRVGPLSPVVTNMGTGTQANGSIKIDVLEEPPGFKNVQANWDEADTSSDAFIQNKPTIPDAQVQSDWNETSTSNPSFIKNKPNLPEISYREFTATFPGEDSIRAVNHYEGVPPATVTLTAICKVANNGYSVGDEIIITNSVDSWENEGGSTDDGLAVQINNNSTTQIRRGNGRLAWGISKTSYQRFIINTSQWNLGVKMIFIK